MTEKVLKNRSESVGPLKNVLWSQSACGYGNVHLITGQSKALGFASSEGIPCVVVQMASINRYLFLCKPKSSTLTQCRFNTACGKNTLHGD